jgi:hypothetical protein
MTAGAKATMSDTGDLLSIRDRKSGNAAIPNASCTCPAKVEAIPYEEEEVAMSGNNASRMRSNGRLFG